MLLEIINQFKKPKKGRLISKTAALNGLKAQFKPYKHEFKIEFRYDIFRKRRIHLDVGQDHKKVEIQFSDSNYILESILTNQKVKRAAPGAEGLVIDHFSNQAVSNYLKPFKEIFEKKNYPVRAFYNDSYEVYGANWAPLFFDKFKQLRGYDLQQNLDVLAKNTALQDCLSKIYATQ